jgi:hypothetical protein
MPDTAPAPLKYDSEQRAVEKGAERRGFVAGSPVAGAGDMLRR